MNLLRRIIVMGAVLLGTQAAFAQERFELDMNDIQLQGQDQIIYLKQEILRRYGVQLQGRELLNVRVVAKSRHGQGQVVLNLQNGSTQPYQIYGQPNQFNNPAPQTFSRIDISPGGLQTKNSPWQLVFRGNIIIRKIVVQVAQEQLQQNRLDIHRFYTGRAHFWTLNQNEGVQAGFRYEGVGFQTLSNGGPNRTEIFRCYTGATHFVSTASNCEGQRFEGSLGFVAQSPVQGSPRELVRCYKPGVGHLITVNRNECIQNQYGIEGVLGYVR